ncbi:hypothetical protein jhhlp_008372 [Lomentospora prolificans]|uniref:Biotrophy-associated secreted protein 2 n=1 Tax=Lomentospora prolificans TaxID=41688 RepID=A0A2N3MXV6_9PEZI|nr:hypothetical protein jhhlp_008372 [Lomentospora prolificans]
MVRFSIATLLLTAGVALARPADILDANHIFARQSCAAIREQAGSQNVGTGTGQQFITGQCLSSADCASGCCVLQQDNTGECKARLVTEQNGASCDFVCGGAVIPSNPVENVNNGNNNAGDNNNNNNNDNINNNNNSNNNAAEGGQCAPINSALSGSQNVGTGAGTQFITGACQSPADCASGCCVSQGGGAGECKARLVTEQNGLSCDFSCVA